MTSWQLGFDLKSLWHIGSSAPTGTDVDAEPTLTPEGLPYIPGKSVRGLLRDSLQFGAELGLGFDAADVERWLGSPPAPQQSQSDDDEIESELAAARWGTKGGRVAVTSAELGETPALRQGWQQWARDAAQATKKAGQDPSDDSHKTSEDAELKRLLFQRIAQTKLDGGTATTGSLRATRVCLPMKLFAELEWTEPGAPDDARKFFEAVKASLPFLLELGRSRTRGFGSVRVKIQALQTPPLSARSAPVGGSGNAALLRLTLLEDVVVSQTSATSGGHRSHTLTPGAQLLGAAASKLYASLGADAWRVFHQGAVRFGDGLWVDPEQHVCEPTPLSWHKQKTAGTLADLALDRDQLQDTQWTQQRDGYTASPGAPAAAAGGVTATDGVRMRFGLRTSLQGGVARDGLLYGYEAIERGQTFASLLQASDPADLQRVAAALDGAVLRIGRSRSTEYGRVLCKVEPLPQPKSTSLTGSQTLVLRAVSDLCLRDLTTGQPTLQLDAQQLGLPDGWRLDSTHSYLRTRAYRPFHGVRKRPAMERQVLMAGSVFCLCGPTLSEAEGQRLQSLLQRGVGLHLAEGLGRLVVHHKGYQVQTLQKAEAPAAQPPHQEPLFQQLQHLHREQQLTKARYEAVTQLVQQFGQRSHVKQLGKAQWGALRAAGLLQPRHSAFDVMEQFVRAAAAQQPPTGTNQNDRRAPDRAGGAERRTRWHKIWDAEGARENKETGKTADNRKDGLKATLEAHRGNAAWDGQMLAQWAARQAKQGDER